MLKIAKHKYGGSRVWWYIPVTPGTQEAEQEDHKFEVSLSQNKKGWQCSSGRGSLVQSPVLKKEGKEKKEKKKKRTNRGNSVVTQRQNSVSWFWSSPSEH